MMLTWRLSWSDHEKEVVRRWLGLHRICDRMADVVMTKAGCWATERQHLGREVDEGERT